VLYLEDRVSDGVAKADSGSCINVRAAGEMLLMLFKERVIESAVSRTSSRGKVNGIQIC